MHALVNALSTTNLSGQYVLAGHLSNLARWTLDKHRFTVLYHGANREIRSDLGPNVDWLECPDYTTNWMGRMRWELTGLSQTALRARADLILSLSGTIVPGLSLPQVSYAMNPEPMIPGLKWNGSGILKRALQRCAYRRAMGKASLMLFLSKYIRGLYRHNAGFLERHSEVVYPGLSPDVYHSAQRLRRATCKKPFQVLFVSVMAPHKGIDRLLRVMERVRTTFGVPARLFLVGPWPNRYYLKRIRGLIPKLGLSEVVQITGFVNRDELERHYAESKLFCSMSQSESFGIPSLETQAFATPVVGSDCGAIPEVCGQGGVYTSPFDVEGTSRAVAKLLTEGKAWNRLSSGAEQNAARFRWEECSRPLLAMFDRVRASDCHDH